MIQFTERLQDVGPEPTIGSLIYRPGNTLQQEIHAIKIHTDSEITGEFVGGFPTDHAAIRTFARSLIGKPALGRENIFNDIKQATRQQARMGQGVIDIALWDIAGKFYDAPIYELLGGSRKKLKCYASTYIGDREPDGLSTPEAYADFAQHCMELGYPAFKIHGWQDANIEEHIELVHAVGRRVGNKMDLMLDPFCAIQTFGDALKLGRACDEENFYWLEDPFKDGGVSAHAHRKLRQSLKTPLLQLEHVRGLESHVDFIEAEATDFVRGDALYDGGITGIMKIAHAAEGFGLDIELHVSGPVQRHLMTSIRNTNYYEMGPLHPKIGGFPRGHIYSGDYRAAITAIDENGCVDVPEGPGLGVQYDWNFISDNQTGAQVFK